MDSSLHGITPLRQRMIDDMRMRKLAEKTQSGYVRVVRQFTAFLGRAPDTATVSPATTCSIPWRRSSSRHVTGWSVAAPACRT